MPRVPAIAAVAAVAMLAAAAYGLAGVAFGRSEEHSRTVTGKVTRIEVDGSSGNVALLAAEVPDVTIHERRRFGWRAPTLDVALRGGVLRVRVRCASWSGGCADDLDIVVPRAVRAAAVRVDSGAVSLAGLVGDRFIATSDSGDLRARRIAGDLALRSDSGDIEAGAITGRAELRTDSGDIQGRGLPRGQVVATSDSGDIAVR